MAVRQTAYQSGYSAALNYRIDASGKQCGKGYIPSNKQCRTGDGAKLSSPDEWWDDPDNIDYTVEWLGGKDWINDLVTANKMPRKIAEDYARKTARSFLLSQHDNNRGNAELEKVNREFDKYFRK